MDGKDVFKTLITRKKKLREEFMISIKITKGSRASFSNQKKSSRFLFTSSPELWPPNTKKYSLQSWEVSISNANMTSIILLFTPTLKAGVYYT